MVTMASNKYGQYYDRWDDPYGHDHRYEEELQVERIRREKEMMYQQQQQVYSTVPVTYGTNTFTGTFTDLQLNTGGAATTIPLNLTGGGELPAALEGQKESPLQWLDRRVNEICKVGALQ